jgi:hypothetical protein
MMLLNNYIINYIDFLCKKYVINYFIALKNRLNKLIYLYFFKIIANN